LKQFRLRMPVAALTRAVKSLEKAEKREVKVCWGAPKKGRKSEGMSEDQQAPGRLLDIEKTFWFRDTGVASEGVQRGEDGLEPGESRRR